MHRGHHHHDLDHGAGGLTVRRDPQAFGPGHNHAGGPHRVAQWQAPHLEHAHDAQAGGAESEPDLDLVETAFVEAFATASDPTSFLRLAQVPFRATTPEGAELSLLRVEVDDVTDVGSVMPHLGGESFRYDPLPAALVARRRRLRFVYGDGATLRELSFAEVRALRPSYAAF
jgi:hypothetical protein